MKRLFPSTLTIPVVIVLCALLGGAWGGRVVRAVNPGSEDDVVESQRVLTKVYAAIEDNYADAVNPDKVIYNGAVPGALRTLDPHTNFFDPKAFGLLREEQKGKYYGVGMQIMQRNGKVMVQMPFVGSPAYKAGLRPGDIIAKVDDKATETLNTADVADLLKGPKGTTVRILVKREGEPQPLEFIVTRGEIPRNSIEQAFELKPGIGYIRIINFNETTGRELQDALKKFDPKSLKGLVLDLRANPGGLLTEGVSVAGAFLNKGQVVVSHRGRASSEKFLRAPNQTSAVLVDCPLVVLINRTSASASEIVAGAVQDHDRGLVVGETSFGKGLVQTVFPLTDNTGLALTTAYFYTPSKRLIQRKYDGLSLYDYYYLREDAASKEAAGKPVNRQITATDSGRTVYGGGGITPDVKVEIPKPTGLLRTLQLKYGGAPAPPVGPNQVAKYAFFEFARHYLGKHRNVPRNFEADDSVIAEFRQWLDSEQVTYTDAEFAAARSDLKLGIKEELLIDLYGKIDGERMALEHDPVVLKALEAMPQAKQLSENAHRIIAQRSPNPTP